MTETLPSTEALKGSVAFDASTLPILIARATSMRGEAVEIIVDSPDMAVEVGNLLTRIAQTKKQIEEARANVCGPVHKAWKNAIAWFKPAEDVIEQADSAARKALTRWTNEQAELARKARAEAERVAREERQRLEQQEAQRQAAARDAERQARELAEQAEKAAAAGDTAAAEQLQQQAEAQAGVAETAQAEAHAVAQEAAAVTVQPVVAAPAKQAGIAQRMTYTAEVQSLQQLVHAVAEGKVPLEALQANMQFLGAQAKAFKRAGPLYPGVVVNAVAGLSVRA